MNFDNDTDPVIRIIKINQEKNKQLPKNKRVTTNKSKIRKYIGLLSRGIEIRNPQLLDRIKRTLEV